MKRIAIGILAHVDSGKTTLSEAILYRSGQIRRLGRVDHGDAFLDTNEIEREKGITIFSKQAVMRLNDTEFTLLDTPGHIDFFTETERTLQVLDYAVLVISGTEGVQNHTETLWKLLVSYNIPVFIFVNKMDISERTNEDIIDELKNKLNDGCVDFSDTGSYEFAENAAMCDERLMEEFLSEERVTTEAVQRAIRDRNIFPCFFGSALKISGIDEFLNALDRYITEPERGIEFGAKVFKISEDEQGKRLTHLKVTSGVLRVKDTLCGRMKSGEKWQSKVDFIRIYSGDKFKAASEAPAGTVCAVIGPEDTYAGEGLGVEPESDMPVLEPVLNYKVDILDGTDVHTALSNLRRLEEEEPQLHIIWNEPLQEIHIELMGEVQIEVLKRIIADRFNMETDFGKGSIAYRETIAEPVEGIGHFEPLRHYSEVHLLMEPLERGCGLEFATNCSEDALSKNWQRLIMTHLKEKTHLGVLTGSPITDMRITLVAGRAHKKHTEGGDFREATYRAVRQGLKTAESILLEPYYSFRLEVPTDCVGRAMTDIEKMGGEFSQPELSGDSSVICGSAPVSQMLDYPTEVTSYTRGRGRLYCTLKGYYPCRSTERAVAEIGYDSDADIDNPADSVFCAHGAGFIVKWDEVKSYAHVDSGINLDGETEKPEVITRVSHYLDNMASDEELLKIFEKTYGPVKVRSHSAMKRTQKKHTPPLNIKTKPIPVGPEYLLVDGYNIIFAWDDLKSVAQDNLDAAREILINRLCNYCGYRQCKLILVFDAYKVKGNPGSVEKVHNINVVYTKEAETADAYIERVTHEIGRKHRVRVATSDNLEQIIILGNGATRVSANAFQKEVEDTEKEIRQYLERRRLYE